MAFIFVREYPLTIQIFHLLMVVTLIFTDWPASRLEGLIFTLRIVVLLTCIGRMWQLRGKKMMWRFEGKWIAGWNFYRCVRFLILIAWAVTGWWPLLGLWPVLRLAANRYGLSLKPVLQEMEARDRRWDELSRAQSGLGNYTLEEWAIRRDDYALLGEEQRLGRLMTEEEILAFREGRDSDRKKAAARQETTRRHREAAIKWLKTERTGKPGSRIVSFEFEEPWEGRGFQGGTHWIPSGVYPGTVRMTPVGQYEKGEPAHPAFLVEILFRFAGKAVGGEETRDISPLFRPVNFSQAFLWRDAPEALKREAADGSLLGPVWIRLDGFSTVWRGLLGGKEVELLPGKREHGVSLSVRADGRTLLCRVFGLLADPLDFGTLLEPFCFELPVEALARQAKVIKRVAVELGEDGVIPGHWTPVIEEKVEGLLGPATVESESMPMLPVPRLAVKPPPLPEDPCRPSEYSPAQGVKLVTCNLCGSRVLPKEDGNCPQCGGAMDPRATLLPLPSGPSVRTAGSLFRDLLIFQSLAGIIAGLALAVHGGSGGTWPRGGKTGSFQGLELFWAGLGISGICLAIFLTVRRKKR